MGVEWSSRVGDTLRDINGASPPSVQHEDVDRAGD